MKRDHHEARAGAQAPRRRLEESIQPLELAVHPDAQRLKRPRGRVDPGRAAARDRAAHDRCQATGRGDGRLAARVDDGARDPTGKALFAVLKDGIGQLALRRPRDQISGRFAGAPVHAHVQRLVALKAEAAARLVELHRRHAKVGESAVDERDAQPIKNRVDRPIIRMDEIGLRGPWLERLA